MENNQTLQEVSTETRFLTFLGRGKPPCDYEFQLLKDHFPRVKAILQGKIVPPYELEIQPSSYCNLKCDHCFGRYYDKIPGHINKEELRAIANKVYNFRENGFKIDVIKFCGTTGDPLCNAVTAEGIRLFKNLGKKVIIFTNGTLLNREVKLEIGKAPYYQFIAQADKLNLSLDASSRENFYKLKGEDNFPDVISGLENLLKLRNEKGTGLNVITSFVIGEKNYQEIVPFARLMKSLGVDEIRYRIDFTDTGKVRELSDRIVKDLHEAESLETDNFTVVPIYSEEEISQDDSVFHASGRKCFNHHFWACIGPNSELYACGHRTRADVNSYGDFLSGDFISSWTSERRLTNVKNLPDEKCVICSPSSVRRNDFMTFLETLPVDTIEKLVKEYVIGSP